MKLVKAIVREDKVNEIVEALERIGAPGFTVTEVRGRGAVSRTAMHRGSTYTVLRQMNMIDLIVSDPSVDDVVRVLVDHAHTGQAGDGHVVVMAIDERYAIRTRWRDVA
jgi:nitrogen regulatory protein PII